MGAGRGPNNPQGAEVFRDRKTGKMDKESQATAGKTKGRLIGGPGQSGVQPAISDDRRRQRLARPRHRPRSRGKSARTRLGAGLFLFETLQLGLFGRDALGFLAGGLLGGEALGLGAADGFLGGLALGAGFCDGAALGLAPGEIRIIRTRA